MKKVFERSKDQNRWDELGQERIRRIQEAPAAFIINECPRSDEDVRRDLMRWLGSVKGRKVLELGSGHGEFSVFLAKQGAKPMGIDIGPHLIAASRLLARINDVDCEFQQGNISNLPFDASTYDIVLGIQVLHHLSHCDLERTLREAYRVLKQDGVAVFAEPVENSKLFNLLQNIFPAGKKGSVWYRPSILQRKAWDEFLERVDDRALTTRELRLAGRQFASFKIRSYGLLIRLQRLIGGGHRRALMAIDNLLLRTLPPLRYLCQVVLVEYRKRASQGSRVGGEGVRPARRIRGA